MENIYLARLITGHVVIGKLVAGALEDVYNITIIREKSTEDKIAIIVQSFFYPFGTGSAKISLDKVLTITDKIETGLLSKYNAVRTGITTIVGPEADKVISQIKETEKIIESG